MADLFKGIVAGLIATLVLSALLLAVSGLGLMPQFDFISILSALLGAQDDPAVGWSAHFIIGSVLWGTLFAWLEPHLPGDSHTRRGILFGVCIWLFTMIVLMPMAGRGLFGLQLGALAPILSVALHVAYGAVLGWVYGKLAPARDPFAAHDRHAA